MLNASTLLFVNEEEGFALPPGRLKLKLNSTSGGYDIEAELVVTVYNVVRDPSLCLELVRKVADSNEDPLSPGTFKLRLISING